MKNRTFYLFLMSIFLLAGISPVLAQFDDLYYDPDTDYNPSSNDYYSENNTDGQYNSDYDSEFYDWFIQSFSEQLSPDSELKRFFKV